MFDSQSPVQQTSSSQSAVSFDAGLRAHMSRIYNRMTLGVLVTAVVSYFVGNSPELLAMITSGPQMWIIAFAPLAILLFGFNPAKMSAQALGTSFFVISVLYGLSFAVIFQVFTGESIANAFFIATGMFAGLSIVGYTTKKNLDGIGNFAMMGVWGIFFLAIINIFIGSSLMSNVISVVSIIAFAGLTAWDTQRMKEMYSPHADSEILNRVSWVGALELYIDFVAMFRSVLYLMGNRE